MKHIADILEEEELDEESEEELPDGTSEKQASPADRIRPWMFKPGQSGNPAGRPPGLSLKEWAKKYLAGLNEEERLDFLAGMNKETIWKQAEGNPQSTLGLGGDKESLEALTAFFKIAAKPNE